MDEQETASSDLHSPHHRVKTDNSISQNLPEEVRKVEQCENVPEMGDSQLVEAPAVIAPVEKKDARARAMKVKKKVKAAENSGVKRKRGRPRKGQAKSPPIDEEDVCFICFDGGNLVLCDRRGCPKAYHPACIKRDEAFFRSKAKWNCGWHICSMCEKAAHYMCYTCPYSLCKVCIKDADILCVRGDKGFCTTCMRTVMLVENSEQGSKDTVQVDFDDRGSWEYLFKVYWMYLKRNLSLTLDELAKAENPGKGSGVMARKGESSDELYDDNGSGSDSSFENPEANSYKRRKTKRQPRVDNKVGSVTLEKSGSEKTISLPKGTEWASKELLEFVAHMKNGDTSVLSEFDVQALLLEYITRNNLRDPQKKSQIICDSRLLNMFRKPRVAHFEMLNLLESHLRMKVDSSADNIVQEGDAFSSQVVVNGNGNLLTKDKDKRRRRKKGENKGRQANLDEYAAIDVHNIGLIYLSRNLMENLIEDADKFHDMVVGSVVRIRISSSDQKQDMYRLVQVVGTSKVAVPYNIGKRMADIVLEILNLNKKEVVSIDGISNQEFSKDECRRLRQSIKCGLVKRFTVREIQEKAVALQAVRVNDWLETEKLRLNHLRDRASEKGHRKELRECVEKLQLLSTPEERHRRVHEIPEVHADPNMDPSYESEEDAVEADDKKQGNNTVPRYSAFSKRRRNISNDKNNRARKNPSTTREQNSNTCKTPHPEKNGATKAHNVETRLRDANGLNNSDKPRNVVGSEPPSAIASKSSTQTIPCSDSENEKMWHYQDPNGITQGPFSLVQLRKWCVNGYFPPYLTVWMVNEQQEDSILLTDALRGQFRKGSSLNNKDNASAHSNGSNDVAKSTCTTDLNSNSDQLQDSRPSPTNFSSEGLNMNNSGIESKQSVPSEAEAHVPNLPSPTPIEECKGEPSENKQSVSSSVPVQDSNPSLSSASSLVAAGGGGGDGGVQVPEVGGEWGGYSPTPEAKPAVEEWGSVHLSSSLLMLTQVASDLAATPPISNGEQLITGPNEFPLAEESVSDLLAEVDAMESSLNGLPSPTSRMNASTEVPKNDSFNSLLGLSLNTDPGKSDAFSSTGDAQMPSVSTVTNEAVGISKIGLSLDSGLSLNSVEVEGERKPSDVSVNQWESGGSDMKLELGWGGGVGASEVNRNMGWSNGQGSVNLNWGSLGMSISQPKYSGERFSGPSEQSFLGGGGGVSSFGKERSSWNKQSSFGGGGGFSRPPARKGQRICKYHESGHCRKGAACGFLHP